MSMKTKKFDGGTSSTPLHFTTQPPPTHPPPPPKKQKQKKNNRKVKQKNNRQINIFRKLSKNNIQHALVS